MSDQPSYRPGYRPSYRPGYQRHPLDIGPLVFGLVFLGIVAAWGLFELGVVTASDTAWILPIVLIGAGALGVLLAITKPRRTEARQEAMQAAAAAYAGRWVPAGYPEQTGTYAETAETLDTGTDPGSSLQRFDDDTLEQTATTDVRAGDTDTYGDSYTGDYPDTYTSTETNLDTDKPEHRDE